MAVRKRGKNWQIDYFDPNGKRVRRSFKKKKDAVAELAKIESLKAEGRYLDVKKESDTTLGELIEKYAEQFGQQSSFKKVKKFCIRDIEEFFGADAKLESIRYYDLERFRNHIRDTPMQHGRLRTDATVNRWMSCLRHMLKKAVLWELIGESPFEKGETLLLKENNKRMRFLSLDEIQRLLVECPRYLKDIVVCALNTGMRKEEYLSLKWDQIRNGFIYLRKTKTNESRQIPVNDTMNDLFREIRRREHLKSEYVFTYRGERIADIKVGFNAACKRAGITDCRPHDMRHTFASHAIMNGASLKEVQEILGHTTLTMTLRYAHLSPDQTRRAVNAVNGLTCHKSVTGEENEAAAK